MDNGTIRSINDRVRKFPGYTLKQLEIMQINSAAMEPEAYRALVSEIEARRADDTIRKFYA